MKTSKLFLTYQIITLGIVMFFCLTFVSKVCAEDYDADTIESVQQALNDLGYDCGTADGIIGEKTNEAILQYQNDQGLIADGEINDEVLISLGLKKSTLEELTILLKYVGELDDVEDIELSSDAELLLNNNFLIGNISGKFMFMNPTADTGIELRWRPDEEFSMDVFNSFTAEVDVMLDVNHILEKRAVSADCDLYETIWLLDGYRIVLYYYSNGMTFMYFTKCDIESFADDYESSKIESYIPNDNDEISVDIMDDAEMSIPSDTQE